MSAKNADFAVQTLRFFEFDTLEAHRLVSISDDDKLEMQFVDKVCALGSKATLDFIKNQMHQRFGDQGEYKKCGEFIDHLV